MAIEPMKAVLCDKPFNENGWIFEIKWDGYRALAYLKSGHVDLYSRNQNLFNALFPTVVEQLEHLSVTNAILDGEVVLLDDEGKPQFQLLQNFQSTQEGTPIYYVFDLLYLNGHDLRNLPLLQRKALLKEILEPLKNSNIRFSDHIEEKGIPFFKMASKMQLEGIMAKDADSHYVMKRSSDWVKLKTHLRQEVVIGGFTQPQGSRHHFGALLVGVYERKKLIYVGSVGGGFSEKSLETVYDFMQPLITDACPFANPPRIKGSTWIKPKLLCEVVFAEWTSDNNMRQPIFKGLRDDKKPTEVKKETS